jgi:hypothetical protein
MFLDKPQDRLLPLRENLPPRALHNDTIVNRCSLVKACGAPVQADPDYRLKRWRLSTPVVHGAEIVILPAVSGGALAA